MSIDEKIKSSHESFSRAMKERRVARLEKEADEIVILGQSNDTLKVSVKPQKTTYSDVGYGVTIHNESGRIYGQAPYMKSYRAKHDGE